MISKKAIQTLLTGLDTYEASIKKGFEKSKEGSYARDWMEKMLIEVYEARNELTNFAVSARIIIDNDNHSR